MEWIILLSNWSFYWISSNGKKKDALTGAFSIHKLLLLQQARQEAS
jgi:hypothetical protein